MIYIELLNEFFLFSYLNKIYVKNRESFTESYNI